MHPAPFALHIAHDVPDALAALAGAADPAVLAGGLSLVPLLRTRSRRPDVVVDVTRIAELRPATVEHGALVVGAAATQAGVLDLARRTPGHELLAAALDSVGTDTLRRRGTLAGILAVADPTLQLAAVCGVLDTEVTLRSPAGERCLPGQRLYAEPDRTPAELITRVRIEPTDPGAGWAFQRVGRREIGGHLGGAAVQVSLDGDGRCSRVRVAPFVAGHDGSALDEVAGWLAGRGIDAKTAEAAGALAARLVTVRADANATADYRRELIRVVVRRGLLQAARRAVTGGEHA